MGSLGHVLLKFAYLRLVLHPAKVIASQVLFKLQSSQVLFKVQNYMFFLLNMFKGKWQYIFYYPK